MLAKPPVIVCVLSCLMVAVCTAMMQKRVINGENARPKEYPWAVSLKASIPGSEGSSSFCGATLISDQWLLSAAHCFFATINGETLKLDDPNVWHIQAGNVFIDRSYESHQENTNEKDSEEEKDREEVEPEEENDNNNQKWSWETEENKEKDFFSDYYSLLNEFKKEPCPPKPKLSDCYLTYDFSGNMRQFYAKMQRKTKCMEDKAVYDMAQIQGCRPADAGGSAEQPPRRDRWSIDSWFDRKRRSKRGAPSTSTRRHLHIAEVFVHPKYGNDEIEWDIALIKLNKPLPVASIPEISVADLPSGGVGRSWPAAGDLCVLVGWGCTEAGGMPNDRAQLAKLEVISNRQCNRYYSDAADLNDEHEFCAGFYQTGLGICPGDSGSGLVCKSTTNRWTIAGVTSATHSSRPGDFPGLFTRVSYFRKWIDDTVSAN